MKKFFLILFFLFVFLFVNFLLGEKAVLNKDNLHTEVCFETSLGNIYLELFDDKAPISVKNFLNYVKKGFYDGTIFHRVIKDFVIQGGGYSNNLIFKNDLEPSIKNEANKNLKNLKGTIAMARTSEIDSAKNQFFINLVDNSFLDHEDNTKEKFGYAVFGKVTKGFEVVEKIGNSKTSIVKGVRDVPLEEITLIKAYILE